MALFPEAHFDSIVTDPPYELTAARPGGRSEATRGAVMGGFMGMQWDGTGVAFDVETWRQALRVLKPGGHLLAFSGTRTYHRMVCAIEDAGFEIRDQIGWLYGSGFPKSLDVSKAIDKAAGAERTEVIGTKLGRPGMAKDGSNQSFDGSVNTYGAGGVLSSDITAPATEAAREWDGWGTALKPAWEPIVVARKPLVGTVAANVLEHGTGALNIDACRVNSDDETITRGPVDEVRTEAHAGYRRPNKSMMTHKPVERGGPANELGRWPANVIHDGSDEVIAAFPQAPGQIADASSSDARKTQTVYGAMKRGNDGAAARHELDKSAARFFYCAKASRRDRGDGNMHPTVKPTELMRYLCRLVTPSGGLVLDPFAGSGSTGKAAALEGFRFVGFELSQEYAEIARARMAA